MVKVESRIERKYQEIVVYLNQAIKVAGDDEVCAHTQLSTCSASPALPLALDGELVLHPC
jgi:hypothetical protein